MKLFELFSGTGSVGKVAKDYGFDVVSLDLKNANINCNILEWNYKQFNKNDFDVIWSSPPCTEYSRAKTTGVRKIEEANEIVLKTIEIIKYFEPKIYFIENPQTGLLKEQDFMKDFDYFDVDYCKYGMKYRKRTRIWSNLKTWKPRPLCKKDCNSIVSGRHIETAQRGSSKSHVNNKHTQEELYKIPEKLIREIFEHLD